MSGQIYNMNAFKLQKQILSATMPEELPKVLDIFLEKERQEKLMKFEKTSSPLIHSKYLSVARY